MYKVLIIDDDPRIRQATRLSLEVVAGWQALVAASGQAGLVLAQSEQPDAILLDLKMPGMDGVSTLKYLQANARTRSIPVILFTAAIQEVEQQQLGHLPITGVIAKPFEAIELVRQMCSLLNWSS